MTWYYFLDREGLRSDDVDELKNTIYQAESDIRFGLKNSSFSIRLDDLLEITTYSYYSPECLYF
ncbi:MAG: hypothetical protein Ct9H300mP11_27350 [Chloroflexota bacterium]|nr:MAG: hypothetical protein Ct9H300mP11_27350 [Chloroflexota bacterium]